MIQILKTPEDRAKAVEWTSPALVLDFDASFTGLRGGRKELSRETLNPLFETETTI